MSLKNHYISVEPSDSELVQKLLIEAGAVWYTGERQEIRILPICNIVIDENLEMVISGFYRTGHRKLTILELFEIVKGHWRNK